MKFETKYSCGDIVYEIAYSTRRYEVACPACEGTGKVTLANGERMCPECYGRRTEWRHVDTEWHVTGALTVGEVRVSYRSEYTEGEDTIACNTGHQEEKYTEEYMCRETGIGSGRVYKLERLFPTLEDARAECDRLNAEKGAK